MHASSEQTDKSLSGEEKSNIGQFLHDDGEQLIETGSLEESESTTLPGPAKLMSIDEIKASPRVNEEQEMGHSMLMNFIYGAQDNSNGRFFFLNGKGDTGKTWLLRQILAEALSKDDIAVFVTGNGKDACLYDVGRKVKVIFSLDEMTTLESGDSDSSGSDDNDECCSFTALLGQTKVVFWDECHKINHRRYQALDRSLREVYSKNIPFAGIPVVFAGDLGHTFPGIQDTPAYKILQEYSVSSNLWASLEPYLN